MYRITGAYKKLSLFNLQNLIFKHRLFFFVDSAVCGLFYGKSVYLNSIGIKKAPIR